MIYERYGRTRQVPYLVLMLTIFGACAVTFMMLMYALERRGRRFILAFACGCALSSVYGFLAGTWPFGVVEAIWAAVALNRYVHTARDAVDSWAGVFQQLRVARRSRRLLDPRR
jgi:hypothetical protein